MTTEERCQYTLLENGIHELRYRETVPETINEIIAHVERVLAVASRNEVVRFLADGSEVVEASTAQQFATMMKMRALGKQYAASHRIRAAVIAFKWDVTFTDTSGTAHGGTMMENTEILFSFLCTEGNYRTFALEQRTDAAAWLLQEAIKQNQFLSSTSRFLKTILHTIGIKTA